MALCWEYLPNPFIVSWIRLRSWSMLNTLTRTCWWMLTTVVGSLRNLSANWDTCVSPFSLIPISTKHPKLVMFVTIPGSSMPSFKSSMVRTLGSNSRNFDLLAGVASRFVQLLHDIGQCRQYRQYLLRIFLSKSGCATLSG